jgi:hypothetical protein
MVELVDADKACLVKGSRAIASKFQTYSDIGLPLHPTPRQPRSVYERG